MMGAPVPPLRRDLEWTKDIRCRRWLSNHGHIVPFESWQGPDHDYGAMMVCSETNSGTRRIAHAFRLDGVYANCVNCGAGKVAVKCSYCGSHSTL